MIHIKKKELLKISAVVDSGALANALPEQMVEWILLKPSGASQTRKGLWRSRRRPLSRLGKTTATGWVAEGRHRTELTCLVG